MRALRLILALGAVFVLAAGLSACGSDNVATVAGNPISKQAFDHWLFVAAKGNASQSPGAPVIVANDPPNFTNCIKQAKAVPQLAKIPDKQLKSDCDQLFHSLGSQVMSFLIRAYWYQAEAGKRHIKITDKQVQQAFQTAKQQQLGSDAQLKAFLAQSGQTQEDLLFRVRINQVLRRLLATVKPDVSPAAIQAYYNTHRSQFGTPATRDLRVVRTSSAAKAGQAKAALDHGQDFGQVANQFSEDNATKAKGGLLTGLSQGSGQQEQALVTAAFAAPKGKTQGPVHGSLGYYVFQVVAIKPGNQQSLAQATPIIRQLLQSQSQQNSQAALDAQVKKDWQKKTNCDKAYAMADCNGYVPPKNSATSVPGGAGGAGAGGASGAGGAGAGGASGAGGAGAGGAGGASGAGGAGGASGAGGGAGGAGGTTP